MNILFVNPNYADVRSRDAMEPLAFAILAGCTPAGHCVSLIDERLEPVDSEAVADLVAISAVTFTARRAYAIAGAFRKRGIRVVMGGFHPTLVPDEAKKHCDAVVIGDAEPVWPGLLRDAEADNLQPFYRSATDYDIKKTKYDRSIFIGKKYSFLKPIQFGRGCRFSCDFCSVHAFYGAKIRDAGLDAIVGQIREMDSKYIFFVDDNFLGNYANVLPLLGALASLKKKWICQISIDAAFKPELLHAMKTSGCMAVFVGFESLDRESLRQIGKTGNLSNNDYPAAIRAFQSYGIIVCGSFVFGYRGDNAESVKRACEFAIAQKLCIAHFNVLFPTPGTELYKRLDETGRLRYDAWWLTPGFRFGDCAFEPESASHEELSDACAAARKRFNMLRIVARRALNLKANAKSPGSLLLFLAANLVSRWEIARKFGKSLG